MICLSPQAHARQQVDDATGATIQNTDSPEAARAPSRASDAGLVPQTVRETVHSPQMKAVNTDSESNSDTDAEGIPQSQSQQSQTGAKAAEKYFRKNRRSVASDQQGEAIGPEEHYLALGIGGFVSGDSYSWGSVPHNGGVGGLVGQLTYRLDHLSALADWALRADFMGYQLPDGKATQLAISPIIMFPDSGSHFPLYFGIGAGPGVFLQQINQQSVLAINYQLFAGARFFNVIDNTGFFIETGLKNHFLVTSQGQFNGAYITGGAVFAF